MKLNFDMIAEVGNTWIFFKDYIIQNSVTKSFKWTIFA